MGFAPMLNDGAVARLNDGGAVGNRGPAADSAGGQVSKGVKEGCGICMIGACGAGIAHGIAGGGRGARAGDCSEIVGSDGPTLFNPRII